MGVKILFFSRGNLGQNSMFPEKGGQNSIFFPSALKKGGQNRGAYQPTSLKGCPPPGIAAGGYCRRFIMRPDVCPSTDSKRWPYRFEIFSFQNYLDISNIDGSVLNCSIAVTNALETPQSLTKPSICVPRKCWKGPVSLITKHIYCQKLYLPD